MRRDPLDPEGQYDNSYCAEECGYGVSLTPRKQENITDLVIKDLRGRERLGQAKYGRPLLPHDGRDSLLDLYEELLDAVQYIKKYMMEVGDE